MKCTILHEGKGRMRVHVEKVRMTLHRADVLEAYLNHHDAIVHAAVYERTGDVVITYTGRRSAAIAVLAGDKFDVAEWQAAACASCSCPHPLTLPTPPSAPSTFSGRVCAAC